MACAIKLCKNHKNKKYDEKEVTFHKFPRDPVILHNWENIVQKSRKEENWKSSNSSFVCSDHFDGKDIYETKNGLRRLKKGCVPSKALFISSVEDTSDRCEEDIDNRKNVDDALLLSSVDNDEVNSRKDTKIKIQSGDEPTTSKYNQNNFDDCNNKSTDFSDLDSILDSPKKAKLRNELRRRITLQKKHTRQIKALKRKNLRLTKKIASFKEIIGVLKKERFIDNDMHNILGENVFAADLYSNMSKKLKGKAKRPMSKYTPAFRKFCLTLHFLSPKAYTYVRSKFETCLPYPKTLTKWYANIDGSPGLTEDAFKVLKAKREQSSENILCALIADEMAIRQQTCWNKKTHQDEGLVDIGTGPNDHMSTKASEAYMFVLVSLNEPWKLPVAYFLTHGLNGEQKANIIKTILCKCQEIGVDVVSLTFDGHSSNLSAMEILGCKCKNVDPKQLITTFKHPAGEYRVAVFLDICHMIKLIRNHLESKQSFLFGEQEIKWEFIKKLTVLQEESGLHLANKLTKKHVQFRNAIMNVKLATQVLSRSVSKALTFCRSEINLKEFEGCEATEQFIMLMNNIFDVFNSRNLSAHGYRHPLMPFNKPEIFSLLDEVKNYILNLSLKVSRKRTYKENDISKKIVVKSFTPVLQSQSFTGFLGLLVDIESLKSLYELLIPTNRLRYITTYRISQDHLELFFGAIRMHGGYNDNPNARQLKGIYRKLLCNLELKAAGSGNCVPVENVTILTCTSALLCINSTTPNTRKDDEDENECVAEELSLDEIEGNLSRYFDQSQFEEYTHQIVGYIAGCIVRCLSKRIKCIACLESLISNEKLWFHKLVTLRDEGGLIYASEDLFCVCNKAEIIIRKFCKENLIVTSAKNYDRILVKILSQFVGSAYFKSKSDHHHNAAIHEVNLLKLVANKYLTIRC